MAELVNLRLARRRAKRREAAEHAEANRLAHGRPKHQLKLEAARQDKANRDLDLHRVDKRGNNQGDER